MATAGIGALDGFALGHAADYKRRRTAAKKACGLRRGRVQMYSVLGN